MTADPLVGALPLRGLRVIDTGDDCANFAGRVLADLGADVILVEPPAGSPARRLPPLVDDASVSFFVRNANKRSVIADVQTADGQQRLLDLLATADIWIDTARSGAREGTALDPRAIRARLPRLVVVSITPFGLTGPYKDHAATHAVLFALSGMLSLSRLDDRAPLLPPGSMAHDIAGAMAAYAALVAVWNRSETGTGDHLDLSIHEAMVQAGDAVLPVAETLGPAGLRSYPIFRCTDGFVRLILLLPRHTEAMLAWLDEQRDDDDAPVQRGGAAEELDARHQRFFASRSVAAAVEEAQRRGVPLAPVLNLGAVLDAEALQTGGAFLDGEVLPRQRVLIPAGLFEVGDDHLGFRHRAPLIGEHTREITGPVDRVPGASFDPPVAAFVTAEPGRLPLAGVRVLDLGVVYAGPETGKLLADHGADVIRVESRTNPDLARQAGGAAGMTAQFVTLNRNKRSFGVDLKSDAGLELVRRLVRMADVLVENMAHGTLEKLGLGPDALHQLNPRLVVVRSQLFGRAGTWSDWRGFGPSARGVGGLTTLWRYPDDETGFAESTSVFPDHFVGRLGAVAALAWLIDRRSSARGRVITVPQAGAVMNYLSEQYVLQGLAPGSVAPAGNRSLEGAPWGVYRCAGDDEWCVVTVRDDADWDRLRDAIDAPEWARAAHLDTADGRRAMADDVDRLLVAWTSVRTSVAVMDQLQAVGVPAAAVLRPADVLTDPQLADRGFVRVLMQPGWDPLFVEGDCMRAEVLPPTPLTPAPAHGEHTREIATDLLGMTAADVDELVASGVLEVPPA